MGFDSPPNPVARLNYGNLRASVVEAQSGSEATEAGSNYNRVVIRADVTRHSLILWESRTSRQNNPRVTGGCLPIKYAEAVRPLGILVRLQVRAML
ncbi:unannotated protein [freshwater metagenome]|uniref:Unannotated protein n=1 Tax=freshwater metagenome TaxID=449393 RepID=A0A6J7EJD8_9ZZZZ